MSDVSIIPDSVLERLARTAPGTEIWWDASPLVYPTWQAQFVASAPEEERPILAGQLRRLYDPDEPEKTLFRGVTTNPPLSLQAIENDPPAWKAWILDYLAAHPDQDAEQIFWALYKRVIRLGAEAFLPVFRASGYLYGHLSGQVDPRAAFDADKMLAQALELAALAPNVMIKVPGTREGLAVIGELTRRGVSTNCTLGYVVPQFVAVAETVQQAVLEARARGVDLTGWRSVVTQMSVRWENAAEFDQEAEAAGVTLTTAHKRWASITIFKQAHRLFLQRAYPSKMLICSLRLGPFVDGMQRVWHLEKIAGANAIFTMPPGYIQKVMTQAGDLAFKPQVWDPIPANMLADLEKIPYFHRSVATDGWQIAEFNDLPPLRSTHAEFSAATEKMVAFVRETIGTAVSV